MYVNKAYTMLHVEMQCLHERALCRTSWREMQRNFGAIVLDLECANMTFRG